MPTPKQQVAARNRATSEKSLLDQRIWHPDPETAPNSANGDDPPPTWREGKVRRPTEAEE